MSTLFVINLTAVLIFPPSGHLLGLTQSGFGLWAGTAVNDTFSVVATGYAFGHAAGVHSVIVKLTRTTIIIPAIAALGFVARRHDAGRRVRWHAVIPWFLVWFIAAAMLESLGAVPAGWHAALSSLVIVSITVALAAIGLGTMAPRRVPAACARYADLGDGGVYWPAAAVRRGHVVAPGCHPR